MFAAKKINLIELDKYQFFYGLEKLPAPLEELLMQDAFRLPERKIEDNEVKPEQSIILGDGYAIPVKAYEELYGERPIWDFKQAVEDKKSADNIENTAANKFQLQFIKLLDSLICWGKLNKLASADLTNLENFKNSFFQLEYSGNQTSHYFIAVKQALEKIWYVLTKKDNIPLKIKLQKLKNLNINMGICDSGAYTNLMDIADEIIADRSTESALAKLRRNIADGFASHYCYINKIFEGNQIHVSTALYAYQAAQKWGAIIDTTEIKERYSEKFTYINEEVLLNFHDYFSRSYSPKAIYDCICAHCETEMNFEVNLLATKELKEDKEGWMPYHQPLVNAAIKVARYVGGEWSLFLEYKETTNEIRYNPHLFRANFLKYCEEKNKYFQQKFWQKQNLSGEFEKFKIHQFSEYEMSWIEMPDGKILEWQRAPKDIKAKKLLAGILSSLSEAKTIQLELKGYDDETHLRNKESRELYLKYKNQLSKLIPDTVLSVFNSADDLRELFANIVPGSFAHLAMTEVFFTYANNKKSFDIIKYFTEIHDTDPAKILHKINDCSYKVMTSLINTQNFELADQLLEKSPDVSRSWDIKHTGLHNILECKKSHPVRLALTLQKENPDCVFLENAINNNHFETAAAFINEPTLALGIKNFITSESDKNNIMLAIDHLIENQYFDLANKVLKILGDKLLKMNAQLLFQRMVVHGKPSNDAIKILIESKTKLYLLDRNGDSILRFVCHKKNYELLKYLLESPQFRIPPDDIIFYQQKLAAIAEEKTVNEEAKTSTIIKKP